MTVSLVTGANSGIGRSIAAHLAGQGHTVYAGMRDVGKAEKLIEKAGEAAGHIFPITVDITDDASVAEAFAGSGPLDVLVNNAGIGLNATTEDLDLDAGRLVFETNLWGTIRCIQAALPAMRERGSGHIVNISSVLGRTATVGQTAYCASKWALEGMSEALVHEVGPFGIRVSIVEPGITRTAILPKNIGQPEDTAYEVAYRRMFQMYQAGIAANVSPDEVASVVWHAITTDEPRLRYPCTWGGRELTEGRARLHDEDWVALGMAETDDEYFERFESAFGLDIRPPTG
jgi:NAD(P)-dependent dehydrogenase (short-subunit alcohol dehydrogenase family)